MLAIIIIIITIINMWRFYGLLSTAQQTETVTKEQKTKEEQVLPLSCTC